MKKIILGAVLASCAMTSAYAGADSFRLYCTSVYDSEGPVSVVNAKIAGTNDIAYVRLYSSVSGAEAYEFTYTGQKLNEVGESRYYDNDVDHSSIYLSKDSSEATLTNNDTPYFITFECGV